MKQYLDVIKLKFIYSLQYRSQVYAGILTQVFFGLVYIMVYLAFYESGDNYPMALKDLIAYLWLNQAFFSLVYMWTKDQEFLAMIKNGNIAYELCRPSNFYLRRFVSIYAKRITAVSLRFIPVLIVAFLMPKPYNLILPMNLKCLILFITSLFISSFLVTAISLIFHLITIFTLNEKGVLAIFSSFAEILAGGVVPLVFFPDLLYKIAYVLPFRYVSDLPFRIYTGNIYGTLAIKGIVGSIIWTIITIIIGILITKKALKKATIQGG